MSEQPFFRFLDLPKELRFIVYEHFPLTTITRTITRWLPERYVHGLGNYAPRDSGEKLSTLHHPALPAALLATCKLVRSEATRIFSRMLHDHQPSITIPQPMNYPLMRIYPLDCFNVVLAVVRILHRDGILFPEHEALQHLRKVRPPHRFDPYIAPCQEEWMLHFGQSCVQYASKHRDQPCMHVYWQDKSLFIMGLTGTNGFGWNAGLRVRCQLRHGTVILFDTVHGELDWKCEYPGADLAMEHWE